MPPKAPPFPGGPTGSPPGSHQAASVSRYAGSTQLVRRVSAQSPSGRSSGGCGLDGAAAALHLAGHGPRLGEGLADGPAAVAVGHRDERVLGRGRRRRSRPGPARRRDRRAGGRRPRSRPGGRPRRGPGRRRARPPWPTRPTRRSPTPRRWSATRCSGTGGRRAPGRPQRGRRARCPSPAGPRGGTRCPGVQKPHWLAPVARKAPAQRSRSSSSRPSTVVMTRPATRRTGVTQATRGAPSTSTVQHPHWPCGLQPSFGERIPRWSRRATSSDEPSSGTSTGGAVDRRRRRRSGAGTGATGSDIGRRIGSTPDEPRTASSPRSVGVPSSAGPACVGGLGALALGAPVAARRLRVRRRRRRSPPATASPSTTDLGGRQLVGLFNYTGGYVEAGTPQRLRPRHRQRRRPPRRRRTGHPHRAAGPGRHRRRRRRSPSPATPTATPIGYYPLVTTFDQDGTWTVATELDGQPVDQAFRVEPPGGSPIRQVGAGHGAGRDADHDRRPRRRTRSAPVRPSARSTTRPSPRRWPRVPRWRS